MLSVAIKSIILIVLVQNVVMLSVIMLSVAAPFKLHFLRDFTVMDYNTSLQASKKQGKYI